MTKEPLEAERARLVRDVVKELHEAKERYP